MPGRRGPGPLKVALTHPLVRVRPARSGELRARARGSGGATEGTRGWGAATSEGGPPGRQKIFPAAPHPPPSEPGAVSRGIYLPLVQPPCPDLSSLPPSARAGEAGGAAAAAAAPGPARSPRLSSRPRTPAPGREKLQTPARAPRRCAADSCPPAAEPRSATAPLLLSAMTSPGLCTACGPIRG